MKAIAFTPANLCYLKSHNFPQNPSINLNPIQNPNPTNKPHKFPSLITKYSQNPSTPITPPLFVVGSANADIYVEIERLPIEGETISAKNGQTLAGGKGANQAACGGKLSYPTYFVGQVGEDANGKLIVDALSNCGVKLDYLRHVNGVPTGHAVVMLQSNGENSIIIVGGANMSCWPEKLKDEDLMVIKNAGIVLLQREIPDFINIQVAKAARNAGVPVILDAGGMDTPIPLELLKVVDILSPNESELGRITGMPTDNFEQLEQAVKKLHEMGVRQVLVKLGENGSAFLEEGQELIKQPIVLVPRVLDTTGAGDTFTAAFAVALVEGKTKRDCMRFAAAAAALCVQVKGALLSMPNRTSVLDLLKCV